MRVLLVLFTLATTFMSVPVSAQNIEDLAYIQRRLFDLNYYSGDETGVMDQATIEALKLAQRDIGEEPTGNPSEFLLFGLRYAVARDVIYGAAAVAHDAVFAVAVRSISRRSVRDQVMQECKSRSTLPDTCYWGTIGLNPVVERDSKWILTVFHCSDPKIGGYGTIKASDKDFYDDLMDVYLNEAKQYGYKITDCGALALVTPFEYREVKQ